MLVFALRDGVRLVDILAADGRAMAKLLIRTFAGKTVLATLAGRNKGWLRWGVESATFRVWTRV